MYAKYFILVGMKWVYVLCGSGSGIRIVTTYSKFPTHCVELGSNFHIMSVMGVTSFPRIKTYFVEAFACRAGKQLLMKTLEY